MQPDSVQQIAQPIRACEKVASDFGVKCDFYVVSDDLSRQEQEKLAQELQRACSPTQYSESLSPNHNQDAQYSEPEEDQEEAEDNKHDESDSAITFKNPNAIASPKPDEHYRVPTPEAPSLGEKIYDTIT